MLMLALALAIPAATDRYAVGAVKADFNASRRIGTRRAGLVCLPAGGFKWSDARPALADARSAIATVLHDQAPTVFDAADDPFSDEPAGTRFKLVATIEDFTLNACVRNWGIASKIRHGGALAGRAHISVTWDAFDRIKHTKAGHETIDTEVELAPETADAAEALLAALRQNAARFGEQRPATLTK